MPWMKHAMTIMTLPVIRWLSVSGLLGCIMLAFMPLGCVNSIETAPLRYREQHKNDGHLLPDITVQRLQACVEEYGSELEPQSYRIDATVQVDQEGQFRDVVVGGGLQDIAPDLAACTRITLREMSVPGSVLQLRRRETMGAVNQPATTRRNEAGNVLVLVEIAVVLGEFVAQNGARAVLYSVAVEVVAVAGVLAITQLQKKRKECQRHLTACLHTSANDKEGNNLGERRCLTCFGVCKHSGEWPKNVPMGTCSYPGQRL